MNYALIIAGGSGNRMGQDIPKQFINVYDKPVLIYTLESFQRHPMVDAIDVVCLDGWHDVLRAYANQFKVSGGKSAQESIRNGVYHLETKAKADDIIIIHDGIRPLVDDTVLTDVIQKACQYGNGVTSLPYNEQIFIVNPDDETTTREYIPRETLRRVSTPQAYQFGRLDAAYHEAFEKEIGIYGSAYTNTMMVELGETLHFAAGSDKNIKLTTKDDLEIGILNKQHPLYQEDLKRICETKDLASLYNKRFLITGATGLIGVCLIDALMKANAEGANITIYALGRSREKAADRLGEYYANNHFHFVERDARVSLADLPPVDVIIPLASNTHPLAYSQFPIETIEINVKGAEHALEKALTDGATVLYPSTVEVYGNARGEDIFTEDYTGQLNLRNARACYPESKRLSEALCQSYITEEGVKVKLVRLSRVFGPTMLMSDSKASSQFIVKALKSEDIVLKSKGEQLFSYTYMADAVSAMLHVLIHGEDGVPYNIANKDCDVRLKDFARLCAEWAKKDVVFDLPSETEQKGFSIAMRAILDNQRLLAIGWQPGYDMKTAISRTLDILK